MSICNLTVASSLATVRARSDTLTRRSRSAARSSASSVCGLEAPRCSRCARESCGACSMRAARARAARARAEAAIAISRGAACVSERLGARARRWRARGNAPARNAPARAGKLPARIAEKRVQLDCGKKGEFQLRARVRADLWLVGWRVGWVVGWVVGRSVKLPTESESTRSPAKRSEALRTVGLGLCLGLMDRVGRAEQSRAEQSRALPNWNRNCPRPSAHAGPGP